MQFFLPPILSFLSSKSQPIRYDFVIPVPPFQTLYFENPWGNLLKNTRLGQTEFFSYLASYVLVRTTAPDFLPGLQVVISRW
jgi:hypothetical protein